MVSSRKRKRVGEIEVAPPRKRAKARVFSSTRPRRRVFSKIRRLGGSIVRRSCDALRRHIPDHYLRGGLPGPCHVRVKIGDTFDIFSLLGDFLISNRNRNHNRRRLRPHRKEGMVSVDHIRGKNVLIYMLPLRVYCIPGGLSCDTRSIIATVKERDSDFYSDFEFEVVFVPANRGPDYLQDCATNRFNEFFAEMPWLAVPFSNKRACDRLQDTFFPLPWLNIDPRWALIDHTGKVLLTSDYVRLDIFYDYGIGELVPLMHKLLPSLVDARGNSTDFAPTLSALMKLLTDEDEALVEGMINFERLLASPFPDFLLTKDGKKVPVSVLKDKVVGLYFCNHAASGRSRIKSIKKIYKKIARLGYDFEIVQIDFNYHGYFRGNVSCREDVPWLTLPYLHSRCKRLVRVFKCCTERACRVTGFTPSERECLVIIDPHEANMWEDCFFERYGIDIICRFGVEAYPFTQRRVFDLLTERRAEEIKLRLIFSHDPLLRRLNRESWDQVPVSQLWGRRVLVIFATHSKYKPCKFMTGLKSKYLEQKGVDGLEVVYVSFDGNASTFDDCVAGMPWLVHPYSWEFARAWVSKAFAYYDKRDDCDSDDSDCDYNNGNSESGSDSDSDFCDAKIGAWCGILSFGEDGEYISRREFEGDCFLEETEYPFFNTDEMGEILYRDMELRLKYGVKLSSRS